MSKSSDRQIGFDNAAREAAAAAAALPLEWEISYDENDVPFWTAASCLHDDGVHFNYQIDADHWPASSQRERIQFRINGSDGELIGPADETARFDTWNQAAARCKAIELDIRERVASSQEPVARNGNSARALRGEPSMEKAMAAMRRLDQYIDCKWLIRRVIDRMAQHTAGEGISITEIRRRRVQAAAPADPVDSAIASAARAAASDIVGPTGRIVCHSLDPQITSVLTTDSVAERIEIAIRDAANQAAGAAV